MYSIYFAYCVSVDDYVRQPPPKTIFDSGKTLKFVHVCIRVSKKYTLKKNKDIKMSCAELSDSNVL